MSQTNDLVNAVVALLAAELTDYTVQGAYTQLHAVDPEQWPLCMVFEPSESNTRTSLGGVTESTTVSILLVRDPEDAVAIRDDADSVRSVFDKSPRVSNKVDWSFISESLVVETIERYTLAALTLETSRERSS